MLMVMQLLKILTPTGLFDWILHFTGGSRAMKFRMLISLSDSLSGMSDMENLLGSILLPTLFLGGTFRVHADLQRS